MSWHPGKLLCVAIVALALAGGCVARVDTDPPVVTPADDGVDVNVDPPNRGPDVDVKVD